MINVAILGGGFMGATHAAAFTSLGERSRVKTVASHWSERAQKVAHLAGAELTTDLEAVYSDPEIDVVDICLPTPLHREAAERAFAAGKHVLLEKPIALTFEDAVAIARAADASGRLLMVALVLRFSPEYVEIERRIRSGELGRPLALSAYRLSPPADWNDWMRDPKQSGGTPVDLMIHDVDQANLLLGRPKSVLARPAGGGSMPAHVQALVEYGAAEALVEGSMAMPASYPFSAGIRVLCEKGVMGSWTLCACPQTTTFGCASSLRIMSRSDSDTVMTTSACFMMSSSCRRIVCLSPLLKLSPSSSALRKSRTQKRASAS